MAGERLSGWRKLAAALWSEPDDPQIYGILELRAAALLAFIDNARRQGHHLTPTHLIGRAVAHALSAVPELNVRLVSGRAIPRESIEVFFITAVARGRELTGVKVSDIDRKSAVAVARELDRKSTRLNSSHSQISYAVFCLKKKTKTKR